jgi:hypothetical protein
MVMQKEPRSWRPDMGEDSVLGAPGQPAVTNTGVRRQPPQQGQEDGEDAVAEESSAGDVDMEAEDDIRVYEDIDYGENDDDDEDIPFENHGTRDVAQMHEYFDI